MDGMVNILLVDDQPAKLLSYEAMLAELGENLICARSGMDALRQLLNNEIALVLMDVSMPGMDGFDTARMIHQHPRFQHLPIIFISGIHVTEMDRLNGYKQGAVDYVPVPVIPQLLRAKVKVFVDLHRKTRQLELLTARMTQLQDEERRAISRELHDSVGQMIAAIRINTGLVQSESPKLSAKSAKCLADSALMIEEISKQIRTISYLLHPPMLDETGLALAVRWLVDGFAERSGIETTLRIASDLDRMSRDVELSIFRVIQESLTNIHRHSGSPTASVRISVEGAAVRVEIEDAGQGFPVDEESALLSPGRCGVGLCGMRERLRLLGGVLNVESDSHGTRVTAIFPIQHADSTSTSLREVMIPTH